jgi:hypothetical protein
MMTNIKVVAMLVDTVDGQKIASYATGHVRNRSDMPKLTARDMPTARSRRHNARHATPCTIAQIRCKIWP